jgi:hypothetical protein
MVVDAGDVEPGDEVELFGWHLTVVSTELTPEHGGSASSIKINFTSWVQLTVPVDATFPVYRHRRGLHIVADI